MDLIVFPKNQKIDVKIVNNAPYIQFKCNFMARIHSVNSNSKYLNPETLDKISSSLNAYLSNMLSKYLYKTSLSFKSDINGFGKYSLLNFLTIPELKKFDWKNSYQDSIFKLDLNTLIDSSILVTET